MLCYCICYSVLYMNARYLYNLNEINETSTIMNVHIIYYVRNICMNASLRSLRHPHAGFRVSASEYDNTLCILYIYIYTERERDVYAYIYIYIFLYIQLFDTHLTLLPNIWHQQPGRESSNIRHTHLR